jgi:hypothetical protein
MRCAKASARVPELVNVKPVELRANKAAPKRRSSALMRRPTVGWATFSSCAAADKVRWRETAKKKRKSSQFTSPA